MTEVSHAYCAIGRIITWCIVNFDLIVPSLYFKNVSKANKHLKAECILFSISL